LTTVLLLTLAILAMSVSEVLGLSRSAAIARERASVDLAARRVAFFRLR